MPILDIQRTHRRLGKIRMGKTVRQAGKKPYPAKLEQWRLTSPSRDLVAAAAEAYEGTVEEWADAPDGRQWQVFTATAVLPVLIPPTEHGDGDHLADDNVFSQHYEMWSAGGCQRRCPGTGHVNEITGRPCECPADPDQRDALAKQGKACKMTTRLSVLLPEIPDIGTWMLETHGYYGAVELGGAIELLRSAAPGRMIPAQVRIDQRSRTVQTSSGPETRRYAVPVLELVTVTTGALMAGGGEALLSGRPVQIGSGGGQRAVSSGGRPVPPLPGELGSGGGEPVGPQTGEPTGSASAGEPSGQPPATPPGQSDGEGGGGGRTSDGPNGVGAPSDAATGLDRLLAALKKKGLGKPAGKRIYNEHRVRLGEPEVTKWDQIVPGPALDAAFAEIDGGGDDEGPDPASASPPQTAGGGEDQPVGGPEGVAPGPEADPSPRAEPSPSPDSPDTLPLSAADEAEYKRTNRRMQKRATEAAAVLNLEDRDLLRRTVAWNTTKGRATSWRDLTAGELRRVSTTLDSICDGAMCIRPTSDPAWPEGWQVDFTEGWKTRGEAA